MQVIHGAPTGSNFGQRRRVHCGRIHIPLFKDKLSMDFSFLIQTRALHSKFYQLTMTRSALLHFSIGIEEVKTFKTLRSL